MMFLQVCLGAPHTPAVLKTLAGSQSSFPRCHHELFPILCTFSSVQLLLARLSWEQIWAMNTQCGCIRLHLMGVDMCPNHTWWYTTWWCTRLPQPYKKARRRMHEWTCMPFLLATLDHDHTTGLIPYLVELLRSREC